MVTKKRFFGRKPAGRNLYKIFKIETNFFFTFYALSLIDICKVNGGGAKDCNTEIEN